MSEPTGNIYDELDKIDINNLFSDTTSKGKKNNNIQDMSAIIKPEDCLYEKTYKCNVCGHSFKAKTIRRGKTKFIDNDIDLKSHFEPIQPDYYDVVICDKCGYSAVLSKFNKITQTQSFLITENISKRFVPRKYPELYTVDVAIERFKLALLNCVTINAKDGEKAYICLKLAWLYRDKKDKKNEITFLTSAYKGFMIAFSKESFPICGMDENTLSYILAATAYNLGLKQQAVKLLSMLFVRRNLNPRLKLKMEELREILRKKDEKQS